MNEEYDENWDQFELNESKFNVKTTYKETDYSTELNVEKIPKNIKQKAENIINVFYIIKHPSNLKQNRYQTIITLKKIEV